MRDVADVYDDLVEYIEFLTLQPFNTNFNSVTDFRLKNSSKKLMLWDQVDDVSTELYFPLNLELIIQGSWYDQWFSGQTMQGTRKKSVN